MITLTNIIYAISILLFFLFLRFFGKKMIFKKLKQFTSNTETNLDDNLLAVISRPVEILIVILGLIFAKNFLQLNDNIESILNPIGRSATILVIFWILLNILGPLTPVIQNLTTTFGKDLSRDVTNFFVKTLKFLVWK